MEREQRHNSAAIKALRNRRFQSAELAERDGGTGGVEV